MLSTSFLPAVVLLLELIGLFLVAREVYRGQRAETAAEDLAVGRRLIDLHEKGKYDDFLRQLWTSTGSTPKSAEDWIKALPPETLKATADAQIPKLKAGIARWDLFTSKAWHKLRRRDLILGTALLMLATTMTLLESMLGHAS